MGLCKRPFFPFFTSYQKANDTPNYNMVPSYQTVPLANVPKANAPTPVPRRKKVAVAAMMIGMALLIVGYSCSYGASTIHPARMTDIATTTTTMTAAAMAANLVRGGVQTGDTSFSDMEKEDCKNGPCNRNRNKKACLNDFTKGCIWYPHLPNGTCSSCSGVSCGNHRASICYDCVWYERVKKGKSHCNGECKWGDENFLGYGGKCLPK